MLEAAPEAVARALRENPKEAALVIGLHPAVLHACATEQPEAIASCLGSLPAQLLGEVFARQPDLLAGLASDWGNLIAQVMHDHPHVMYHHPYHVLLTHHRDV